MLGWILCQRNVWLSKEAGKTIQGATMVTIPGFEGHFEPLLHCLEDQSAPLDDRVDVYLRVTEWVSSFHIWLWFDYRVGFDYFLIVVKSCSEPSSRLVWSLLPTVFRTFYLVMFSQKVKHRSNLCSDLHLLSQLSLKQGQKKSLIFPYRWSCFHISLGHAV